VPRRASTGRSPAEGPRGRAASTEPVIALLRGVNVGGHGKLPMAELRTHLATLGYRDVRTLLHSGNVVCRPPRATTGRAADHALEQALAAAIASGFGVTTEVIVRRPAAWAALIARNPFVEEAARDPARLMVLCLREDPVAGAEAALVAAMRGPERARVIERESYIFYPDGMGNSRLTLPVIERALGTRGTARNWNTIAKLAALVAS